MRTRTEARTRQSRTRRSRPATPPHVAGEQRLWPVVLLYNLDSTWTAEETQEAEQHVSGMADALAEHGHDVEKVAVKHDVAGALQGFDPCERIVFNWCEGIDGEPRSFDRIPPVLETLGFAYTGADAWTLTMTQDKAAAKIILDRLHVPTPAWRIVRRPCDLDGWDIYPAIAKPAAEHCSFGITAGAVVSNADALRERVDYVLRTFGGEVLVEDYIDGREFNVSIWGDGQPAPLPLYEIDFSAISDPRDRIVNYDAKWTKDSFHFDNTPARCPASVDKELAGRLREVALAAYRALHLRDYGRIDIRVRDRQPYVVDVNSNPDITMDGGFAKTAAVAGYSYGAMASRIISLAARRRPIVD